MIVWLNGELMSDAEARIDPSDRGFLLADGVFETLRATARGLADPVRHWQRLEAGAAFLGLPMPRTGAALTGAAHAVLAANGLDGGDAAVRVTVSRGPGPRGLVPPRTPRPFLLVTAYPYTAPARQGVSLHTVTVRRNEGSPASRHKTLAYLDNVLARREAEDAGDDDALMLNNRGLVACASAANLWLVEGHALVTPPVADGVLPGTARARLLEMGQGQGYEIREDSISPERAASATAIFLSNSLMGLLTVGRLDGREFAPHAVVSALDADYWQSVDYV